MLSPEDIPDNALPSHNVSDVLSNARDTNKPLVAPRLAELDGSDDEHTGSVDLLRKAKQRDESHNIRPAQAPSSLPVSEVLGQPSVVVSSTPEAAQRKVGKPGRPANKVSFNPATHFPSPGQNPPEKRSKIVPLPGPAPVILDEQGNKQVSQVSGGTGTPSTSTSQDQSSTVPQNSLSGASLISADIQAQIQSYKKAHPAQAISLTEPRIVKVAGTTTVPPTPLSETQEPTKQSQEEETSSPVSPPSDAGSVSSPLSGERPSCLVDDDKRACITDGSFYFDTPEEYRNFLEKKARKALLGKVLILVGAGAIGYFGGRAMYWVLSNTVGRIFGGGSGSVAPPTPELGAQVPAQTLLQALEKLEKLGISAVPAAST